MINATTADDLATQCAKASAAMVLDELFFRNIPCQHQKGQLINVFIDPWAMASMLQTTF